MSRVDLEQYRASILKAQNADQLTVVVGELCDAAGYPFREDWSIRDNADAAYLQGAAPLGHMLDIAARRERSYKQAGVRMLTQELQPCARCGISGIHACLGVKQRKMSDREKADFEQAISTAIKSVKAIRQGGAE